MSPRTGPLHWLAIESCWKTEAAVARTLPAEVGANPPTDLLGLHRPRSSVKRRTAQLRILKLLTARENRAEALLELVRRCVAGAGLRIADLDRIALDAGPGPFTGLRMGVAAARGLAQSLNIPVVPVTGFAAAAIARFAAGELRNGRHLLSLPSTAGRAFMGTVRMDSRGVPKLISAKCVFTEDGGTQGVPRAAEPGGSSAFGRDVSGRVGAVSVLRAAVADPRTAEGISWKKVFPLYLRPSYAQEALLRPRKSS